VLEIINPAKKAPKAVDRPILDVIQVTPKQMRIMVRANSSRLLKRAM
jgi:hypothetical protein